ncbi:MAG: cytoplasmic protein [Candidatus Riflebacteria bacterium]
MCFAHALLNAIDLKDKGFEVKLVIEGSATGLIGTLAAKDSPFHRQYRKVVDEGILAGVCKACASKMDSLFEAEKQSLPLLSEMHGHPAFSTWIKDGYEIISM